MSQNLAIVSNFSLELLDPSGRVLHKDEGHNIVVNDGLEWMTHRVWGGLSGLDQPAALAIGGFAIILGNGQGGNTVYIPAATDRILKGTSLAKMRDDGDAATGLSLTVPNTIPESLQMTFTGTIDASGVGFHVREMGLGVSEVGGQQITASPAQNYRMLNIASNPPNRDYTNVETGTIRGTIGFRLVSTS